MMPCSGRIRTSGSCPSSATDPSHGGRVRAKGREWEASSSRGAWRVLVGDDGVGYEGGRSDVVAYNRSGRKPGWFGTGGVAFGPG